MRLEEIENIPGAVLGRPELHSDERGSFLEIFREDLLDARFVQANHSHSRKGVLRGLHFHRRQADAWYVINGEAQAMLADLRVPAQRPAVASIDLSEAEPKVLYIPPGVAHGFLAVTDVDLIYWVTHVYTAEDEFGVAWDDPTLAAPWKSGSPLLSGRDRSNPKVDWKQIGPLLAGGLRGAP